jgi:hypothetical protein
VWQGLQISQTSTSATVLVVWHGMAEVWQMAPVVWQQFQDLMTIHHHQLAVLGMYRSQEALIARQIRRTDCANFCRHDVISVLCLADYLG